MRVAAILHPYAKDRLLQPFRVPGMNLFRGNELEANDLPQVAIVFGGDGSVHRVIQALAGSQTPLLVVPTGSGNDFAHAIGIHSYADALSVWRKFVAGRASTRDIDLGVIKPLHATEDNLESAEWVEGRLTFAKEDGRFAQPERPLSAEIMRTALHHFYDSVPSEEYFCCIACAGLDSETNRLANKLPAWLRRRGGYIFSALRALSAHTPTRITLSAEGNGASDTESIVSSDALLVAFANAPSYGNGMRMAPGALLDDGRLDVCFVRTLRKLRVLRLFPSIFSGTHLQFPEVKYFTTQSLRIVTDRPLEIFADGEYICNTPASITVRPKSLRILAP